LEYKIYHGGGSPRKAKMMALMVSWCRVIGRFW